jgi:hypothetical protein
VIHRTFRSLDDAPKLVGFTIGQWAALIGGGILVLGVVHIAHLPTKVAITLLVFTIGLPAALAYVSESGGLALGRLLTDVWRWRVCAKSLPPACTADGISPGVLVSAPTLAQADADESGPDAESTSATAIWERWR